MIEAPSIFYTGVNLTAKIEVHPVAEPVDTNLVSCVAELAFKYWCKPVPVYEALPNDAFVPYIILF